ncbi:MAG: helix-turn-helix domain-containing protein [Alphaproteobacteria bacterium]|nr:helix-turn-helix domain-containing protein [Alphaproteobacteria bacterium]
MENAGLGQLLQKSREKKGLSIDDVVRITRIRKEFLTALEKEDYAKLPERTYALGYFRSYANFLEIENIEELVARLDKTYYFERPRYSNQKGQVFLDDEYGLVNTIKKKFSGDSQQEETEVHSVDSKQESSKKTKAAKSSRESSQESAGESLHSKGDRKEAREEGGFSSHGKLIIVLCVFLFIFLFLGYKLIFSGSSKDSEDSIAATQASEDSKKIDSIIENNYVVVENNKAENTQANKVPNQQLTIKSQNPQDITARDADNINIHEGTQNNQANEQNQNAAQSANEAEKPKIEIRAFPRSTRNYQISIAFAEDVWIQIYKQDDPNVVYLDKIFKAGDIFDVPKVDNIAMNVGNYRGIKILVDNKEVALSSSRRNSVVLNNIVLEKNSLLEKYQAN